MKWKPPRNGNPLKRGKRRKKKKEKQFRIPNRAVGQNPGNPCEHRNRRQMDVHPQKWSHRFCPMAISPELVSPWPAPARGGGVGSAPAPLAGRSPGNEKAGAFTQGLQSSDQKMSGTSRTLSPTLLLVLRLSANEGTHQLDGNFSGSPLNLLVE